VIFAITLGFLVLFLRGLNITQSEITLTGER